MKKILSSVFIIISLFSFATQRPVPGSYATIQSALNACLTGDTVMVQPGTYLENLNWPNIQNIKLFSLGDSSNTIIDANYSGRCITITNPTLGFIDTNTVISGFKLRNGFSDTTSFVGVAIYVSGSMPLFKDLAITNCNVNTMNVSNPGNLYGGVIYMNERGVLKNCAIYNNTVYNSFGSIDGGLIYIIGNSANPGMAYGNIYNTKVHNNLVIINGNTIIQGALIHGAIDLNKLSVTNNMILDTVNINSTNLNGLIYINGGTPSPTAQVQASIKSSLIANNTFSSNTLSVIKSMGIYYSKYGSSCDINRYYMDNVTIADNKAITNGTIASTSCFSQNGGPYCLFTYNMYMTIANCIFYNPDNNPANEISQSGVVSTSYQGILTSNPQFLSVNDHHLQFTSPAINAGIVSTYSPATDIEFTPISSPALSFPDIGCYEMNQPTTTLNINTSISSLTVCQGSSILLTNTTPNTTICYWSSSAGVTLSSPYSNTCSVFPYAVGSTFTINVMITDNNNAIGTNTYVINYIPNPTPTITLNNSTNTYICAGQTASLIVNSINPINSYSWNTGATSSSIIITPSVTAAYSVSVINSNGCVNHSVNYFLSVIPLPTLNITSSNSGTICMGQNISLSVTPVVATSSYSWNTGNSGSTIVITPSVSGIYTAIVTEGSYGCSSTDSIFVSVSICTGLHAYEKEDHIDVYPNPNTGNFIIECNSSAIKYEVLDVLGQLLFAGEMSNGKKEINLRSNSKGVYFIRINDSNSTVTTKKIIVQ